MSNKFVLNADDLGMSEANNRAVLEGYECGILKSASIVSNGEAFDDAAGRIIKACPDLCIGVHLNITDGKSLLPDLNTLTDENGIFYNSYLDLIVKSYNFKDKTFLTQVEQEFRAQIEKVKNTGITITHLDSHNHIHAIPPIFNILCKIAKEFGITQVRTQFEKPYIVPDVFIHLNKIYLKNIFKFFVLNMFTVINDSTLRKYNLKTNDYIIGILYNNIMTSLTVSYGLRTLINNKNITAEILIHPRRYENGTIDNCFTEYQLTKNKKLKNKIEEYGFEIGNYKN